MRETGRQEMHTGRPHVCALSRESPRVPARMKESLRRAPPCDRALRWPMGGPSWYNLMDSHAGQGVSEGEAGGLPTFYPAPHWTLPIQFHRGVFVLPDRQRRGGEVEGSWGGVGDGRRTPVKETRAIPSQLPHRQMKWNPASSRIASATIPTQSDDSGGRTSLT